MFRIVLCGWLVGGGCIDDGVVGDGARDCLQYVWGCAWCGVLPFDLINMSINPFNEAGVWWIYYTALTVSFSFFFLKLSYSRLAEPWIRVFKGREREILWVGRRRMMRGL
jgi:hypothetical protein